jgi:hypothetical protein
VAAEPYETIAFAIPSKELVTEEEDPDSIWENWDPDSKVRRPFLSSRYRVHADIELGCDVMQVFSCQFLFR